MAAVVIGEATAKPLTGRAVFMARLRLAFAGGGAPPLSHRANAHIALVQEKPRNRYAFHIDIAGK